MAHKMDSDIVISVVKYNSTMKQSGLRFDISSFKVNNCIKNSHIDWNMPVTRFTLTVCSCTQTKMETGKAFGKDNPKIVKISENVLVNLVS